MKISFRIIDGDLLGQSVVPSNDLVEVEDKIVQFIQPKEASRPAPAREHGIFQVLENVRFGETACVLAFEPEAVAGPLCTT